MLLGILLVRAETGTFDMVALAEGDGAGMSRGVQVLAFLALALGFAVKTPMWPLHTWLPDAHTAAPTVGSVLLAGVLLKMGTYGLVRVALPIAPEGAEVLAPWLARVRRRRHPLRLARLPRADATSSGSSPSPSVGHMGFVLLGIATLTPVGINGALFANIAHGLITGLLFFLVGAIKDRHHTADIADARRRPVRADAAARRAAGVRRRREPRTARPGRVLGRDDGAAGRLRPRILTCDRGYYLVLMALAGLGVVLTTTYFVALVRRVAQGTSAQRWREALLMRDATGGRAGRLVSGGAARGRARGVAGGRCST